MIICGFVILGLILLFTLNRYLNIYEKQIVYEKRDYYDKILENYIEESYESIYSKHILPFIANRTIISTDHKDKFFISISKMFLDVLRLKLGKMLYEIYIPMYSSEEKFTDYVLLQLSLRIQQEMAVTVIQNDLNQITEQNKVSENISTEE